MDGTRPCELVAIVPAIDLEPYLLPLDLAPAVLNASWPAILVPTLIFHLYYTKKRDLRA